MRRRDYMLAVLAAGDGSPITPAQVQNLFFLLDRMAPQQVEGPWFDFQPSDDGPFDNAVDEEMRGLAHRGLVELNPEPQGLQKYSLTPTGLELGRASLGRLPPQTADYVRRLS